MSDDHAKFSPTSVPKRIYYAASHMARDPRDFMVWRPIPSEATFSRFESPWGPGQITVNLGRSMYAPTRRRARMSAAALMACTRTKCAKEDAAMNRAIEAFQKSKKKKTAMYTGKTMQARNGCVVARCEKDVKADLRVAASAARCSKLNKAACDVAKRAAAMSKIGHKLDGRAYTKLVFDVARS